MLTAFHLHPSFCWARAHQCKVLSKRQKRHLPKIYHYYFSSRRLNLSHPFPCFSWTIIVMLLYLVPSTGDWMPLLAWLQNSALWVPGVPGSILPHTWFKFCWKGVLLCGCAFLYLLPYQIYQEDLQMFDAIRQELGRGQRPFSGHWRPAEDGQWKTPWRSHGERGRKGAGGCWFVPT